MPKAEVTYIYASGDAITLSFEGDATHPDALDEYVARVVRLFEETVGEPIDQDPDVL